MYKRVCRMIGIAGAFIGCIFTGHLYDDVFDVWLGEGLKLEKCIAQSSTAQEQAETLFSPKSGLCVVAQKTKDHPCKCQNQDRSALHENKKFHCIPLNGMPLIGPPAAA